MQVVGYLTSWIPSYDWSHFNCRHSTQFSVTYTETYWDIAVSFRTVFALTFTEHCAATRSWIYGACAEQKCCQDQYVGTLSWTDWAVWREIFAHCRGGKERMMAEAMGLSTRTTHQWPASILDIIILLSSNGKGRKPCIFCEEFEVNLNWCSCILEHVLMRFMHDEAVFQWNWWVQQTHCQGHLVCVSA